MFWQISSLSPISPVELILDKEDFTLDELLDEEDIIQECKALNTRLINFLRDRAQVEQLLCYIVEDVPEDADSRRAFKFPFVACEIFTCEIDVILKTLVEDEELMDILFSFLEPNRSRSSVLAGYFSKVVVCLMLRKTNSLVKYVQAREAILLQLVNLIGITSIMEILVRLVGGDDHMFPNYSEIMQWLSDANLLEMIVDKLSPSNSSEVNSNAAEVLSVIIRNAPSALTNKLSSQSFISRIFDHALHHSASKSSLVQSLSVCIALLDPKRCNPAVFFQLMRSQHLFEQPIHVDPGTISAMLPKLSELIKLLSLSSDINTLPTTFGELRPPLGKHRLKVVEFITVLLETGNEAAEKELIKSGALQIILDLFFEYPYNNSLHHLVENLVVSCLDSKHIAVVDHLFCECNIIRRFLQADKDPLIYSESIGATIPTVGRKAPRAGNIGHVTRICNKVAQLSSGSYHIRSYLQKSDDWIDWQTSVLSERNSVENVYRWACGRPTSLNERLKDSDEDPRDTDYAVATLANNISDAFKCSIDENEDMDEVNGSFDRDDEDVYFDDGSAEVAFSSLNLGVDQQSYLFTNSNWFAFQEEMDSDPRSSGNLNGPSVTSGSDDQLVVGAGQQGNVDTVQPRNSFNLMNNMNVEDNLNNLSSDASNSVTEDASFFRLEVADNDDLSSDQGLPEWVGWKEPSDIKIDETNVLKSSSVSTVTAESTVCGSKGGPAGQISATVPETSELEENEVSSPCLFERDAELVGIELEVEKTVDCAFEEDVGGNWRGRHTPEELCL